MAKKRKTREQKKLADLRHTFIHQKILNVFETRPSSTQILEKKPVATTYFSYPYLVLDLTKTFILTSSIIAIQVLLFVLLKTHILKIPG
ncbi:MAG: hypothetical protein HYT06_01280, partial [Candidatus Levybacteria bacterium]|nr:hypothetical protein [Candidatus Levybacteria bacterium]